MRLTWLVLATFALLLMSCTSSEGTSPDVSSGQQTTSSTSTTLPPVILGLTPNLELQIDQCWAELPPPVTSDIDTTVPLSVTEAPATVKTVPKPLGDLVSSIPVPTIVAEVACDGTNEGRVFATFCLGANPEAEDPTQPALSAAVCDPVVWPGDRTVRRTAVRLCLERFEQIFGESYAQSDLVAMEFTPTEGIWNRGQRTVVCWVQPAT